MSRNALKLIMESPKANDPARLAMLRPTMVTIVNCMNEVQRVLLQQSQQSKTSPLRPDDAAQHVLETLNLESQRSVTYAVEQIVQLYYHQESNNQQQPFSIGTFSRSSTVVAVLNQLLDEYPHIIKTPILCSRSVPGGEGELMALDLYKNCRGDIDTSRAVCVSDEQMKKDLANLDLLVIGADCVLKDQSAIVNKVGTADLLAAMVVENEKQNPKSRRCCRVLCCADRFKVWDDILPPPLEEDLFELIPVPHNIDQLLLPPGNDG
jgi:translation initiation factor 2B subunit (eIF-2B alpha/beta/delta family)